MKWPSTIPAMVTSFSDLVITNIYASSRIAFSFKENHFIHIGHYKKGFNFFDFSNFCGSFPCKCLHQTQAIPGSAYRLKSHLSRTDVGKNFLIFWTFDPKPFRRKICVWHQFQIEALPKEEGHRNKYEDFCRKLLAILNNIQTDKLIEGVSKQQLEMLRIYFAFVIFIVACVWRKILCAIVGDLFGVEIFSLSN